MAETTVFYEGPIVTRAEATAKGLKRYFTGTPCIYGHIDERYVSSKQCLRCLILNTDKKYAADAKYRANNLENRRVACLVYRSTNLAQRRSHDAAYYANNREARIAAVIIYRLNNLEKLRPSMRASARNYRARKVGAPGEFTADDERKLRERQTKCHICGKRFTTADPATIDHVIALINGGTNDPSNIALAHHGCNSGKQARRTHLI